MKNITRVIVFFGVMLLLVLYPRPSPAMVWDYSITDIDTPVNIDASVTTAIVDTEENEIRLPHGYANSVAFWGSGEMDYIVTTNGGIKHYSFDGSRMVENNLLKVNILNPLSVTAGDPFPDIITADSNGIRHFSFSGSAMVENPVLSVAGLTGVMTVGSAGMNEVAAIVGSEIQHYSFSGASMIRNAVLEPELSANPLSIALGSGGYDIAVLERDQVIWYSFTGSGMVENPALAITGLNNPVALAIADPSSGYDFAVVEGESVKHYSFDGSSMVYNSTLSVTSGLTNPTAIAIRPGSQDRLIVDGDEVKYYQWNGSSLVYNPDLSVIENEIVNSNLYASSAVVQSLAFDPGVDVNFVRVRAAHELPDKTSVIYSVTADGTNWVESWRVRGTATGTVLETISEGEWTEIGIASDALPEDSNPQLWVSVPQGNSVQWRATLATSDPSVTPKIAITPRGGVAVRLDTDSAPLPPILPPGGGACFTTAVPELTWEFVDSDPGDFQSAFQVEVALLSDSSLIWDSDWMESSQSQYSVPASYQPDVPSVFWSSGEYQFKYRVRVRDQLGLESPWSGYSEFCIVAFERPRVAEIIDPPAQTFLAGAAPIYDQPSLHIVITPGMDSQAPPEGLPRVKAGAKTTLLVDSIGPLDDAQLQAQFPYLTSEATVNSITRTGTNGTNKRYRIEFWTDANLDICPSGTVVEMNLSGSGAEGATIFDAPPYAEGVIVSFGSIFHEWNVVLQGRN